MRRSRSLSAGGRRRVRPQGAAPAAASPDPPCSWPTCRLNAMAPPSACVCQFPIPNQDGSKPPAVDRVEIYALAPGRRCATAGQRRADRAGQSGRDDCDSAAGVDQVRLIQSDTPKPGTPKPDAPKPEAPPDPRPAAGDVTTFLDPTAPGASGSVRYYAAVAAGRQAPRAARRRFSPCRFAEPPAMPRERSHHLYGTQLDRRVGCRGGRRARFVVDETDDDRRIGKAIDGAAQETTTFERPVEFGKPQCFVVRSAEVHGAVTTRRRAERARLRDAGRSLSAARARPACRPSPATAASTSCGAPFRPPISPAMSSCAATARMAHCSRCTATAVTATSFQDATARSGATYVYAVAAADKASPPNVSDPSNRSQATARAPEPHVRRER